MPNIPHNYSTTFRAVSLLGSQCCVLRYAAAPLTPCTVSEVLSLDYEFCVFWSARQLTRWTALLLLGIQRSLFTRSRK